MHNFIQVLQYIGLAGAVLLLIVLVVVAAVIISVVIVGSRPTPSPRPGPREIDLQIDTLIAYSLVQPPITLPERQSLVEDLIELSRHDPSQN